MPPTRFGSFARTNVASFLSELAHGCSVSNRFGAFGNSFNIWEAVSIQDAVKKQIVCALSVESTSNHTRPSIQNSWLTQILDSQRLTWWVDLRNTEKDTYQTHNSNFDGDERYFRRGFEAAQHSANRGKSYEECRARLGDRYAGDHLRSTKQCPYSRRAEASLVCMDAVCGDLNFTNPTEGE